ncbi:hypothetical protein C8D87_104138 [Lentzea atacamensis]|uniref:Uncharacterized protein n=1 Tax=Lentzea atacamensis TaxID=531938 RepID=A0ABX9EB96_9PSEU|nr:hypothetical protein [Lentzea atacamensis]RAS65591.1 hypothetical protein C8D87_104138 [Lentzea atacamensis]
MYRETLVKPPPPNPFWTWRELDAMHEAEILGHVDFYYGGVKQPNPYAKPA